MSADFRTRVTYLTDSLDGYGMRNERTRIALLQSISPDHGYRELFINNYNKISEMADSLVQPGVAIVAFDACRGTVAGRSSVAAKVGLANSAIIGRHSQADLSLRRDDSLSLRHLAVILEPLALGSTKVRYRVMDLRTASGFRDEHDRPLAAVVADGPMFLCCAGYVLFFALTHDMARWPASPAEAWQALPARAYTDERPLAPETCRQDSVGTFRRSFLPERPGVGTLRRSFLLERPGENKRALSLASPADARMTSVAGPILASRGALLLPGEEPLGVLTLRSDDGVDSLVIGTEAARRGILLGRARRCEGDRILGHNKLSRVHLLVIQIGDRLYAIDTASTNGMYAWDSGAASRYGQRIRLVPLASDSVLVLARRLATLTWLPAEPAIRA